jgi:hypothetical protein
MIKTISKLTISFSLCFMLASSIFATDEDFVNKKKTRLIFGLGIQFDPNGLGGTIVKDGLDSGQAKFDSNGNYTGQQKIILEENRLQALETLSVGTFNYKSTGPMTAGNLALGAEKDVGENFFVRGGINLSTKIMGGHQTSNFMGYNWYDTRWFYKSMVVPVYFGIKLNFGSRGSIYVAPGIHYYEAQWQLKGKNDGVGLDAMTGGAARSLPGAGDAARPSILYDDVTFKGHGFGTNFLWGVQTRVSAKGYVFIEIETFFSYTQGNGRTTSRGGQLALSPTPAYPVTVGGNVYRFGYKHEL